MAIRLFPRTIPGLAISFAAVAGLITFVLGMATLLVFHWELERQLDQRIAVETHALLDEYHDHGFATLQRAVTLRDRRAYLPAIGYLAEPGVSVRNTAYILTDGQGRRRAGSLQAAIPAPGWSEFVHFRKPDGSIGEAQALNTRLADGGRLVVAADRQLLFDMHAKLVWMFSIGYAALLILEALVVVGFARVVRRRLLSIESAAHVIMAGDLSRRMPLDGSGGEFDRLSRVLNRMLERIGALLDNLRQVSADIAHDLRTPLTRIRARLETVETALQDMPQQPLLTTAVHEMDDLLDLFSGLLALSEVEGQPVRHRFVRLDLADLIEEITEAYRPALEQAGMSVEIFATHTQLLGDRSLLQRCVANLLDNVLIHTGPETSIRIIVERDADGVTLLFADDGPGIPAEDHDRVFRRLTRLDRSRSTPGHGLGMSMVAAIAAAHGGSAKILPQVSGLTVQIRLTGLPSDPAQ